MCFQINGRSYHAAQCVKLWIINKAVYYILSIDTFEQQYFLTKGILQSPRLEDHMNTIDIYQSLCNRSYFEHKCLINIKKIYQLAGNFDDQQNLKDVLDSAMVSTTE